MGKDRALEAAAEALYAGQDFYDKPPYAEYTGHRKDCCRGDARKAVAAYLDSLLGDLPEEEMEAAWRHYDVEGESYYDSIKVFLRSLRQGADT